MVPRLFSIQERTYVWPRNYSTIISVRETTFWANLLHGYTAVLVIYWNELFNQVHGQICYMGIQRFSSYTRTSYSIRFMGKSAPWVYSGSRHILERVIQSGSWANLLHGYTAVLGVYWNELFNQVHGQICYMGIQRFSTYTGTSYSIRFMGKSATWVYSGSRHILERVIQPGSWANLLHG